MPMMPFGRCGDGFSEGYLRRLGFHIQFVLIVHFFNDTIQVQFPQAMHDFFMR